VIHAVRTAPVADPLPWMRRAGLTPGGQGLRTGAHACAPPEPEAGLSLTVGEVALIAAGIGLASPLIAYSTTARLDRERWIREQRSEVYIEMIDIYGRMARKASHQEEQYKPLTPEEWRLLQARVEVFTSDRVFAFRDRYLDAWDLFMDVFDADGKPVGSSTTAQKEVIDERALAVGQLYDDLCAVIRKELRARSLVRRP
jgi:hypothetical protein